MGFNLEAAMANTGVVQNSSLVFGRYTVCKNIKEQLLSRTRKLKLILFKIDVQYKCSLILLHLEMVCCEPGWLHFKEILSSHLSEKQIHLPTVSQMFRTARLYTILALVFKFLF